MIPLTSSCFRVLHANVMEQCMRKPHAAGKTIGIDALVVNIQRPSKIEVAAVYWAVPHEGFPEIHEAHFYLQNELLEEYVPKRTIKWDKYKWKVGPDGELKYII